MKTDELREKYLAFFETKGHRRVASDVLVPTWDPSVLFTPAGMNQFKDHFLGKVKLEYTRAASCQKCLRTGDIDNVGRTAYHHTFFEMLGNFSFGDYFKREAIHWAWEFLTSKSWLGIDPTRLTVSVYKDDDEAAAIWQNEIGLASSRIERLGENDNFWPAGAPSQGPDGVCGPCSEIFFHGDRGGSVEIWNLVFTQFNRVGQPPDNLRPLPSKNIDTGMGLERAAAVLQGVDTNFHIDILRPIVEAAAQVCGVKYEPASENGRRLRRITDHVRACSMAIHENVYPGPKEEKYVIRRLLRRAVLDGHQLGLREPFLYRIVPAVVDQMRVAYPELAQTTARVAEAVKSEESNFLGTLDAGLARIERIFAEMKDVHRPMVDGREAADMYQTYGVPPEVFETLAAENNLAFDWDGYRQAMAEHGERSGTQAHVVMGFSGPIDAIKKVLHETRFLGYEATECSAELRFIVAQDKLCEHLREVGHENAVTVVLDQSPFYAESGGQVGDTGEILGQGFRFNVLDTQKSGDLILHHGHLAEGELVTGVPVTARVNTTRRQAIRRAHSATHILHHSLQKNLGGHAQQQGSKVDEDWLRFDFTNLAAVDAVQLASIEADVQQRVAEAEPIRWQYLPLTEARTAGAMMLFGEKYPDPVRMVSMGQFSKELCGGTHLDNTSEVSSFEILTEEAVSAGTRRIIALTGEKARENAAETEKTLLAAAQALDVSLLEVPEATRELAHTVRDLKKQLGGGGKPPAAPTRRAPRQTGTPPAYAQIKAALRESARALNVSLHEVPSRITALQEEVGRLHEQIARLTSAGAVSADSLLEKAIQCGQYRLVVTETPGANVNLMRQWIDQLRKKASPIAVMLAASGDDKVLLVAGLSRDLVEKGLHAGQWVGAAAKQLGGGGGGSPDMAQAGGKHPERLGETLDANRATMRDKLTSLA